MTTQVLNDACILLFSIIPNVLEDMKHYNNEKSNKGNRYNYLKNIYEYGIDNYNYKIKLNSHDFVDMDENICYLKDFKTSIELNEWILSGMSKKEQDDFFKPDSDQPDSP